MTTVRLETQLITPQRTPRCSAIVGEEAMRYHSSVGLGGGCQNTAKYDIADHKLCGRHAQAMLLKLLLQGKLSVELEDGPQLAQSLRNAVTFVLKPGVKAPVHVMLDVKGLRKGHYMLLECMPDPAHSGGLQVTYLLDEEEKYEYVDRQKWPDNHVASSDAGGTNRNDQASD